jgi:hypothetical protein
LEKRAILLKKNNVRLGRIKGEGEKGRAVFGSNPTFAHSLIIP